MEQLKELIARILVAVVGFLLTYLLMAFTKDSLNTSQWDIADRGFVAAIGGAILFLITTYPGKLIK